MRRKKILPLVAAALGALLLGVADADAGSKSKFKKMFKHMPKPFVPAPVVPVPPPPVVVTPMPVHVHVYRVVQEQVWVPPVYTETVVGYDFFGQPVRQRVMTSAGYYRTVSARVCACGARHSL